jgi:hypothetical protein
MVGMEAMVATLLLQHQHQLRLVTQAMEQTVLLVLMVLMVVMAEMALLVVMAEMALLVGMLRKQFLTPLQAL